MFLIPTFLAKTALNLIEWYNKLKTCFSLNGILSIFENIVYRYFECPPDEKYEFLLWYILLCKNQMLVKKRFFITSYSNNLSLVIFFTNRKYKFLLSTPEILFVIVISIYWVFSTKTTSVKTLPSHINNFITGKSAWMSI